MSYWDTSALVKLFTGESDSMQFHAHAANSSGLLVTADYTRLEFWTTLRRKEAEGLLRIDEAASLLADFDRGVAREEWKVVLDSREVRTEFQNVVNRCYSQGVSVFIRTFDAWHLASALSVGETEIVATDRRLRIAAALLGFQLFPATTP